ncbi:teashirt homolog 1-like [Scleropages formosus]|uniref:Teashirt zinc finger homeobox 1 n=1 Tax=Scleropages formosus TaxID=113540 RepID=A0A8C9RS10_SCLFO|nr:teashirt homolog 1-like [Scleropages formosus]XP_029115770.1 teashirt homolog 1-like [Scleropages formosus]XP_029115771.1 teashirt homolog 1-like [Scleropages formosus]
MPRRKQQEPRRSAAYVPEDELKAAAADGELLHDDGLSLDGHDGEFVYNEDDDGKDPASYQNSPLSTATNPDAGYGSPLSDASDRLADFRSTSSKDGQDKEEVRPASNGVSLQDSLARMKAVYANLISDASWSSIAMDIMKAKPAGASASTSSNGSSNDSSHSSGRAGAGSNHASSKSNNNSSNSSSSTANGSAAAATNTPTASVVTSVNNASANTNHGSSNSGGLSYDWHQAALAKTLQQTPYHLLPEPSLFSTVQLYRQHNKLYGSVFTGASKFRCRDCSAAYDTLVGLTVHMNETGHYRDDNKDKDDDRGKRWSKPRKRSLMEMEGKEDAQKVLKCMYCGHSFESLQDLSVHMIKTKHYQKVPLKEPMPALASKLVPSTKKRALQDLISPCSPESAGGTPVGESGKDPKVANPYVTPNNRYGYQNGASYTWQFEARKAQILKCMECGSSHDTLQQLTAHMMVTGHFLKVTTSASKKGKQLVFDPVVEEKIQSIPLPPTIARLPPSTVKSQSGSPSHSSESEEKREHEEKKMDIDIPEKQVKEEKEELTEKTDSNAQYKYLREEDLEETPKGGMDILKSLENTVSSAISKAQTGTPTWGGYPSIHAAYQLQNSMKSPLSAVQSVQVQPTFNGHPKATLCDLVIPSSRSPSLSPCHRNNVSAMEELVEKVTGKTSVKKEKEEEKNYDKYKPVPVKTPSPVPKEYRDSPTPDDLSNNSRVKNGKTGVEVETMCKQEPRESLVDNCMKNGQKGIKSPINNGCNSLGIITDHSPEQPSINPLSALQSIMNTHLGKASKPVSSTLDPLAMLYKISNSMMEKPIYNPAQVKPVESINRYYYEDNDQPMDLTKSKNGNGATSTLSKSNLNGSSGRAVRLGFSERVASPLRENALMDISDMVKNLTGGLTPKSSTPSSISEKSDADGSTFEDTLEDMSPIQKRKGRQSNWNPQHLLILQAQFASSLRETPEGKYLMTDLGPQERVHICKFTGLSMTTISHWLANVKYQLRRTGGTKFLKNIDSGQPVFLCSDCASQFRTPSTYISHLESHLGFSLTDLSKLSMDHIREQQAVTKAIEDKEFGSVALSEDDSLYQCKLCSRAFVSKHAIKLHLSKTHSKSPEDHLGFVMELEKPDTP